MEGRQTYKYSKELASQGLPSNEILDRIIAQHIYSRDIGVMAGIRYGADGSIETYDEKTGKKTGEIITMGNYCELEKDYEKKRKKEYEEAMKKNGFDRFY